MNCSEGCLQADYHCDVLLVWFGRLYRGPVCNQGFGSVCACPLTVEYVQCACIAPLSMICKSRFYVTASAPCVKMFILQPSATFVTGIWRLCFECSCMCPPTAQLSSWSRIQEQYACCWICTAYALLVATTYSDHVQFAIA